MYEKQEIRNASYVLFHDSYLRQFHFHDSFIFTQILLFFYTGDIIIKEGTIGSKMYFIQEGIVDIVMANGEVS